VTTRDGRHGTDTTGRDTLPTDGAPTRRSDRSTPTVVFGELFRGGPGGSRDYVRVHHAACGFDHLHIVARDDGAVIAVLRRPRCGGPPYLIFLTEGNVA
jgi:hypothetical protein